MRAVSRGKIAQYVRVLVLQVVNILVGYVLVTIFLVLPSRINITTEGTNN